MSKALLRTNKEVVEIYERHKRTLYRICFAYIKNHNDAEDIVQDTFIQLIKKAPAFQNEEHEGDMSINETLVAGTYYWETLEQFELGQLPVWRFTGTGNGT